MTTIVWVNPRAGSGRGARHWQAVVEADADARGAVVVREPSIDAARAALARSISTEVHAVVAVGGDGTLHQVVNALRAVPGTGEVPVGLIPAGTGSDLAKTVGIPRSPVEAWSVIRAGRVRAIDTLRCEGERLGRRWVVNVASAGVSGAVAGRINRQARRGPLTYVVGALVGLASYRAAPSRMSSPELTCEGPFLLFAAANGPTFGKGIRVAPRAVVDDGLVDVVAIRDVPRWQYPARLAQVMLGRHLGSRFVHHTRVATARLEPLGDPAMPVELDGEEAYPEPVTITVEPASLPLLRP